MFKFVVLLVLIACAWAGLLPPTAVVYTSPPEHPFASGYEYEHSIQTPDYATHTSVSSPLNGFANLPPVLRTVYNSPLTYSNLW